MSSNESLHWAGEIVTLFVAAKARADSDRR